MFQSMLPFLRKAKTAIQVGKARQNAANLVKLRTGLNDSMLLFFVKKLPMAGTICG